jgi:RecB family exonuclease
MLGKGAVLSRRFLSWDKFKEKTFSLNMDFSPANSHIRTLFASSLLEKNKIKGSTFKGLINPEHSSGSSSYLSVITSILTEVKSFRENSELKDIILGPGVRQDLDFLYSTYTRFLEERELFEPSWVRPEIKDIGEEYILFFPEVIEDYKEFALDIEKSAVIRIVPIENNDLNEIKHFSSSTLELKFLLGKIGSLMDKGIRVQDIAITLPNMDNWRLDLESEANLRSIPLDFRQGKTLSEYPGARLFINLLNCEKSGFSILSMKQILLNSSIPWKDTSIVTNLFNFGLNHHCFKNYILRGKKIDVWENALVKSEEPLLLSFYMELKSGIKRITNGKTFGEIKIAVQTFVSYFLDTNLWPQENLKEFQFCLDTLNDLEEASIKSGNIEFGSSCDLWLSAISDKIYVKRSDTVGINVFPYRVAGGAAFSWHFIPGLSQATATVVKSKYNFLKDNQRDNLTGLDIDFTEPFINLYNLGGINTVFSYSTDSFNGPALPPSLFVLEKSVSSVGNTLDNLKDEYLSELGYWAGKIPFPKRIFPSMKRSFDFALLSAFSPKKIDYTNELISIPELKQDILKILIDDEGFLALSPSSLDQFTFCPYSFLFKRGFKVDDNNYKEIYLDHSIFGQVIHECFDQFFKYVDGEFSKSLLEEYKTEISQIIDKVFNRYLAKGDAFIPPVWNYCREFTRSKLVEFINVEANQFPGYRLASTEKKYSSKIIETKIEMSGRIDRVSFKGDKTAIVDYKKNNNWKQSEINSLMPATFQIPFYIYLVEKSGLKVSSASYYNVTKAKYDHVYNPDAKKSWCSVDDMAGLIIRLEESVDLMNKRIRDGNFSIHPDGCDSCTFRRICRTKYHVR